MTCHKCDDEDCDGSCPYDHCRRCRITTFETWLCWSCEQACERELQNLVLALFAVAGAVKGAHNRPPVPLAPPDGPTSLVRVDLSVVLKVPGKGLPSWNALEMFFDGINEWISDQLAPGPIHIEAGGRYKFTRIAERKRKAGK